MYWVIHISEFFASFLIAFREIFEMVLIVGIILVFLAKTEQKQMFKFVGYGVLAGLIGSLLIAGLLSVSLESIRSVGEELVEGLTALLAACVITYVVFWISRNQNIKQAIHSKVQEHLDKKEFQHQALGLFALSFFAVLREGFELVLLISLTTVNSFNADTLTAIVFGIGLALILGYILFKTAVRLNLSLVFKLTTIFLALFAAGLIVTGFHELSEAGVLPEFAPVIDVSNVINDKTDLAGQMLNTVFGFRSKLNWLEILGYFGYLGLVWFGYKTLKK
ncbi:MAG: FTR1 family protein [Candidatus Diapherotrites archaeon]|nr:FTR1 family protein [Candidatus Diapherotrites archaeon]